LKIYKLFASRNKCVTPKYFDKFEPNKILTKFYVLETFETLT